MESPASNFQNNELSKLRLVFEQTPGSIFILDRDFRFEYVNPGFERLSGFLKAELIGKSVAEVFSQSAYTESGEKILKKMIAGEKWEGEMQSFKKDGSTYWATTVSSPFRDENGNLEGYIIIQQDVTDRKKIESELRESEKFYRDLIENSLDAISLNQDGHFIMVNTAFCKTFGYTYDEIMSKNPPDFIAPEDYERVMNFHIRRMNGEMIHSNYKANFIHKSGRRVYCDLRGTTTILNGRNASFITLRDITEQHAMENALRESEEKYRNLIENATDGIVIVQNGLLRFANHSMCDIMKYSMEELLNKPFLNFIDNTEHESLSKFHNRRMQGEQFSNILRSQFIRKDGKMITVELNARTSNYNGSPAGFIVIRDISERIKIEEELLIAKTELEKLNSQLEKRVKESSKRLTEAHTQLINLQKENLQSQYDVLKQQVNPHFLFNSLNVLTSLIKLDPDLAEEFSEQLSKVYRYVLDNKDNELVNLNTELNFLDAYIFLLNIRFMGKLIVNIHIPDENRNDQIIPLAMQLLIENAIKHNVMSKSNPLIIDIYVDAGNNLNIINNLQARPSQIASTGVGLKNILNRYKLLKLNIPTFEKTEHQFIARIQLVKNTNQTPIGA